MSNTCKIASIRYAEIASIEGIRMRIHQKNLILAQHHTAFPDGQIISRTGAQMGLSHQYSVDQNPRRIAAYLITGHACNLFQQGPIVPDISMRLSPSRVSALARDDDPSANGEWIVAQPIQPFRRTLCSVPNQTRLRIERAPKT